MDKLSVKVVQVSSVHPAFDTRIFHKVSSSLADAGYDVDLIIQNERDEVQKGVNIIALPVAKRKSDRVFKIFPKLLMKCLNYSPNTLFHFHDPELIPLGLMLKFFGYKVIYDVHEDVPKDILTKLWIPKLFRRKVANIAAKLEEYCIKKLDALIVVTSDIEDRLLSKKTVLIQNYPIIKNEESSKEHSKELRNGMFYLGDITLIRGIREMVRTVELVNKKNRLKLILGGKFSPKSLYDEISKEKGWTYVEFVGWISREELKTYAAESFVGLVLFHPLASHIKAQPNKLFEYMLEGLPVVASNFSLWSEIVEKNNCGILVDPLNVQEIAESINWLFENPVQASLMGENGRKAVLSKYNWNSEKKKLLSLYASVIN